VTSRVTTLALKLVCLLHVVSLFVFSAPSELFHGEPLLYIDHAVHTHRIFVYRAGLLEGGLPWGYDPALAAGFVMRPSEDLGAKPQQVLGVLLPFLSPGSVERLCLFLAALTVPLWTWLACRALRLAPEATLGSVAYVVFALWFSRILQDYLRWGLLAFVAASSFAPLVLARFLVFLDRPSTRSYLAATGALAAICLLHVQATWSVAPALAALTILARPVTWRARLAALSMPGVALVANAFWIVPFVLGQRMDAGPHEHHEALLVNRHLTFESWSQVLDEVNLLRVASVLVALIGAVRVARGAGRRWAFSYLTSGSLALFLGYLGSFLLGGRFQPVRFLVTGFLLLAPVIGAGVVEVLRRVRGPRPLVLVGAFLVLLVVALRPAGYGPGPIRGHDSFVRLSEFVERKTMTDERLMVQSFDGFRYEGYEARALPLVWDREVVGCTYSVVRDPAQFLRDFLLGRRLADWTPDDLNRALDRWGISWVFTRTDDAHELLARVAGGPGEPVGPYRAFHFPNRTDRFLVGQGRAIARVNRFDLSGVHAPDGRVVLRYRFHPAWRAPEGVTIFRHVVPEDPYGFLGLEGPPESLTLHFDTRAMLFERWPLAGG
jgi:hypothetical protein